MTEHTYAALMQKKLEMVSERRDKRQGSIIFDALAPNAAELASFYAELSLLENRTYGDTATGEDLTRRCAERGVMRKPAVKATFSAVFLDKGGNAMPIEVGARFRQEAWSFAVIAPSVVECETAGAMANACIGEMLPLVYQEELATASLVSLLTDGEDEEEDESLQKRYLNSFHTDAFGGNIADYTEKMMALSQVGGVKVYPVWNGPGTVKLVFLDRGMRKPTQTEVNEVQQMIDPDAQGMGNGCAPIGHCVTVEGATERVVSIALLVLWEPNADKMAGTSAMEEAFTQYLAELCAKWAEEVLVVRTSYLEARALACDGVMDVLAIEINGETGNVVLGEKEIPVLGELEVSAYAE